MRFDRSKVLLLVTVFAFAASAAAGTIYSQPYDGSGNLYASQNDTNPGGFGNFATAYDDFTLTGNPGGWQVTDIHWTGGYFNPGAPGNITNFTLDFYFNNGGIPGGLVPGGSFTTGNNANESCSGNICTYSAVLAGGGLTLQNGVNYWLSIEPDMGFPPQWGWATSGVGNDGGYQCFFGTCSGLGVNFAFDLTGNPASTTPEPGTLVLLGTGLLGALGVMRRKMNL